MREWLIVFAALIAICLAGIVINMGDELWPENPVWQGMR